MDLTKLPPSLDVLVLERLQDGRFMPSSSLPAWCGRVRPVLSWKEPLVLEEVFPFLSVVLPEAEQRWSGNGRLPFESDMWAEADASGGEDIHLMALAVKVESSRALLVIRSERLFRENQNLLQRARELRMTHGSLMRELQQKDILIHAIVHDLAAPLHSIIGILSLLSEQSLGSREADWVRMGIQAAERQRELISEILDIFAAENGSRGERSVEPVDLRAAIERVAAEREPVARTHDLRLVVERAPRAAGRWVDADPMRLLRVLTNLIDNAFRYSPPGGVVQVSTRQDASTMTVFVEDEGPGVRSDVLPRLFEKFARGRDNPTGTGLGLFFCRISVENWGGGIGYEQRETGGARFWIRLNVAARGHDHDHDHDHDREHENENEKRRGDGEALHGR
jgi:signal transduction histidine kinase